MPLVVLRELPGNQRQVHKLVMESKDSDIDDQLGYMEDIARCNIKEFKSRFIEFEKAMFTLVYVDPDKEVI